MTGKKEWKENEKGAGQSVQVPVRPDDSRLEWEEKRDSTIVACRACDTLHHRTTTAATSGSAHFLLLDFLPRHPTRARGVLAGQIRNPVCCMAAVIDTLGVALEETEFLRFDSSWESSGLADADQARLATVTVTVAVAAIRTPQVAAWATGTSHVAARHIRRWSSR